MSNNTDLLEKFGNKNPFTTPRGYFDRLTEQVMGQLPERTAADSPKIIPLWDRVKPWIYMAAMFAGVALMINLYTQGHSKGTELNLSSSAEIEDFYQYCEEQYATNIYYETIYLDED